MGYNSAEITIPLKLDNHGGLEQQRDKDAVDDLKRRIEHLIATHQHFQRIAILGVEGGW